MSGLVFVASWAACGGLLAWALHVHESARGGDSMRRYRKGRDALGRATRR